MTALAIFALMLLLLALGAPIALSLLISGLVGLWVVGGIPVALGFLDTVPLSAATSYELITVPMFLVMAELIIMSGISKALFSTIAKWVGRWPGGLAIATAFAGAGFGALCGSSAASAATLAATSVPSMIENKYEPKLAAGVVAISGTLAMLIPPSIALILYGFVANVSIGKLLIAGILPGIMVAMLIAATVLVLVAINPTVAPRGPKYSWGERFSSLLTIGPAIVLVLFVTGSIYLGIATPTEASAIGALGALLLSVVMGKVGPAKIFEAFYKAARTTCMVLLIILAGNLFGYFFTITQTTSTIVEWISNTGLPPMAVMALILLFILFLGCFLDGLTIIILTVPLLLPVVVSLGYDPLWFGIILVVTAEVGMVTPPLGINVFVVASYTRRPVAEVFQGVTPHIIAHIFIIALFLIFPQLIMWAPSGMKAF
jgi:tripartite ATP-independent transporter DctM subunit